MPINPLSASVPAAPIVDSAGNVTMVWRGFFLALQARTGGAPGVSAGGTNTLLTAEKANRIAADAALGAALALEQSTRAAEMSAEIATRAAVDASLTAGVLGGSPAMVAEQTARQAGDVAARGFAFFIGAG
jgi:hypothetical protein